MAVPKKRKSSAEKYVQKRLVYFNGSVNDQANQLLKERGGSFSGLIRDLVRKEFKGRKR